MRFREKLLIFVAAVFVSVLGFYLISSPFVGLYMLAKDTDSESIERYLSECDADANQNRQITNKTFQIIHLSSSYCNPGVERTVGASK